MKLTVANLQNENLHGALAKLDAATGLKKEVVLQINKLKTTVDYELKKEKNKYAELVKKYAMFEPVILPGAKGRKPTAKRNPQTGNIITRPKHIMINNQPELCLKDKDNFEAGFKELMDHTFEVKIFPFKTDTLLSVGCTPAEIRACSPILSDADPELEKPVVEDVDFEMEDPTATDPNSEIKGAVAAPPPPADLRV